MSTQTVYFNNPSSITTLQGQVGAVSGEVNTSKVTSTMISTFGTTGSINNLSVNRFVDKYTINNGMGPYMVDAVPITFRDTFAMPKFSNNLSITTGGAYASTGIGGLHYTTHCEVIPEMEYLRVGPLAQMSYDDNYNIVFKNIPNTSATGVFNVVATGSNGIFKGVQASTTFAPPTYTTAQLTSATRTVTATAGQVVSDSKSVLLVILQVLLGIIML